MKIARKYLPPISLLLISTLGVAYAATNLFTQTFPAIPAVSGTTSNCTTLTPNSVSIAAGSSGAVLFDCSGTSPFGTTPAFSVNSPGGTIAITPTFTLPAAYTGTIVLASGGAVLGSGTCTFVPIYGGSATGLVSGSAITSGSASSYYCLAFQNAPSTGFPTFSITWTTPTTPFTQAFPAISAPTAITSNCATLTPFTDVTGNHITSAATGSSGFIYFDCSGTSPPRTTHAFSVSAPGASVSFTPQFTLTAPYVAVAVIPEGENCGSGRFPGNQITPNTPFTFSSSDSYAYCVQFQNVPSTGLPTFDITWTT